MVHCSSWPSRAQGAVWATVAAICPRAGHAAETWDSGGPHLQLSELPGWEADLSGLGVWVWMLPGEQEAPPECSRSGPQIWYSQPSPSSRALLATPCSASLRVPCQSCSQLVLRDAERVARGGQGLEGWVGFCFSESLAKSSSESWLLKAFM